VVHRNRVDRPTFDIESMPAAPGDVAADQMLLKEIAEPGSSCPLGLKRPGFKPKIRNPAATCHTLRWPIEDIKALPVSLRGRRSLEIS
jgi:hypothetical protein